MSNIEEDIKRCEKLTEPQNANWIGISNQLAIVHLIERIKELEEINTANRKVIVEQCDYIQNKSIPVQKVKDKIEENNKIMIDTQNKYPGTYAMLDEWRNAKAQNDILEELLEDK